MRATLNTLLFALMMTAVSVTLATTVEVEFARAERYLAEGEDKKAYKAYRSLAREGAHAAQYKLAELYAAGKGTRQDLNKAYAWAVLAAEAEEPDYQGLSDELLAQIENTDKARAEADKLMERYGKQALAEEEAERIRRAEAKASSGCTGSRISCR